MVDDKNNVEHTRKARWTQRKQRYEGLEDMTIISALFQGSFRLFQFDRGLNMAETLQPVQNLNVGVPLRRHVTHGEHSRGRARAQWRPIGLSPPPVRERDGGGGSATARRECSQAIVNEEAKGIASPFAVYNDAHGSGSYNCW